jgi:hypothetical protein
MHYQQENKKDQGRRPVTRLRQAREGEEEGEGLGKGREDSKRRASEGGRGSAEARRAEGQAEMKAKPERKPDTQDMLEEHRSCRSSAIACRPRWVELT